MSENRFEMIAVASARAKQLIRGAVPRVDAAGKPARIAQREVMEGKVQKVEAEPPLAGEEQG
jgi:DNA-directed RNA polymerase subunit K/omega